jgi:hypothetical protein
MPGPHPPEFRRRAVEFARELDEDGNRQAPDRAAGSGSDDQRIVSAELACR